MYWALNRHYHREHGITGSRNVCYAVSGTLLSIAVFEWFWMLGFAVFQGQPWVITPVMPQLRIHLQNMAFTGLGFIGVLYMWADSHRFNTKGDVVGRHYTFDHTKKVGLLSLLTVASILLWIYYPLPVQQVTVETTAGTWQSSPRFPQTLYTIDVDPTDHVNAGVWFYAGDNLVHGVNTLAKILLTVTLYFGLRFRSLNTQKGIGGEGREK